MVPKQVIFGIMVSHWMENMMVELVCENRKLPSASFEEIQFWTETIRGYLVDFKEDIEATLLDLRV
jgi:hypothetical protein